MAGHPRFATLTAEELALHDRKNADYAGAGRPLGNLERVAAILALYPDLPLGDPCVVALVFALKHLDAVLWHLRTGSQAGDPLTERLLDISTYAKMVACLIADAEGGASDGRTGPSHHNDDAR